LLTLVLNEERQSKFVQQHISLLDEMQEFNIQAYNFITVTHSRMRRSKIEQLSLFGFKATEHFCSTSSFNCDRYSL